MTDTVKLGLPLIQAAQAQKHVTVNEALARIDALVQLTLGSVTQTTPPAAPVEGDTYGLPDGAGGDWAGKDGQVALYLNGGWAFLTPAAGWRAHIADQGGPALFDGTGWVPGIGAVAPSGAATTLRVIEVDHDVTAGASTETAPIIPAQSLVLGVTARVLSDVTGTAASWRMGIGGVSDNRYGSGMGLSAGSWARGLTSSPLAYYADTPLTLTAEGGSFDGGGTVRLAVHLMDLALPRP